MRKMLLTLLLSVAPIWASALTLNLDSSTLTALPGGSVTFSGTISSDFPATVDLNSISVNLVGDFTVDTTPFFLGPLTVAANGSTVNFALFTVTVADPFALPYGVYSGTISLLGGVEVGDVYDPNVLDLLGESAFSVEVLDPGATAVPEPASGLLLLLAAAAAGGVWLRRR